MSPVVSWPLVAAVAGGSAIAAAAGVYGVRRLVQIGQFSYHNSRLSTMGNPYVTKEEVGPLLDVESPDALMKSIRGDLSPASDPGSFKEADTALMKAFHGSISGILENSPSAVHPLVSALVLRWESEEIKRLLRLMGERKNPLFPLGNITPEMETNILTSSGKADAIEHLHNHPLGRSLAGLQKREDVGFDELDAALDREVLERMYGMEGLPRNCRKGANALADVLVDRYNIQIIVRSKSSGISKEETSSMLFQKGGIIGGPILDQMVDASDIREALTTMLGTHLEPFVKNLATGEKYANIDTAMDRMLLEAAVNLSHNYSLNVGPTIRFIISREMEMKNLRLLFRASFSKWSKDRTRAFLLLEGDTL